jgi:hypothetical protein
MRTLRANGEAGEKVSFIFLFLGRMLDHTITRHCRQQAQAFMPGSEATKQSSLPLSVWIASLRSQ